MSCEGVNGVIRNTPRHFAGRMGWETCWQGSIRGSGRFKSGRSAEIAGVPKPTRHAAIIGRSARPLLPIAPRVRRELLAHRLRTANRSAINAAFFLEPRLIA